MGPIIKKPGRLIGIIYAPKFVGLSIPETEMPVSQGTNRRPSRDVTEVILGQIFGIQRTNTRNVTCKAILNKKWKFRCAETKIVSVEKVGLCMLTVSHGMIRGD